MNRTFACAFVVLAAAVFALGACGGSDGDDDDVARERAQFIAATDRRCTESNERTRSLNLRLSRAADGARDERDLLRRLAPILRSAYGPVRRNAAAFRADEPPAADRVEIERIRGLYDEQAQYVRKLADAAQRGQLRVYKALSEQQQEVVTRARHLSRAYGFKECGSTKSDPSRPTRQ